MTGYVIIELRLIEISSQLEFALIPIEALCMGAWDIWVAKQGC